MMKLEVWFPVIGAPWTPSVGSIPPPWSWFCGAIGPSGRIIARRIGSLVCALGSGVAVLCGLGSGKPEAKGGYFPTRGSSGSALSSLAHVLPQALRDEDLAPKGASLRCLGLDPVTLILLLAIWSHQVSRHCRAQQGRRLVLLACFFVLSGPW
jgi:hypothetical protein